MFKSLRCYLILLGLLNTMLALAGPTSQSEEEFKGWSQVKTPHFIFIYEEKDKQALNELLSFGEDVYGQVTKYFDSYPEKIYCILRGRIDSANGYFSPMPFKIELNITAPNGPWLGARTESWLKQVFIHELTHYVHLVQKKGLWAGLASVFGAEISAVPMFAAPGWMIEGITTNIETRFTSGGRGRNPYFEVYYKAPIIEDKMFTLSQIAYSSPFPPSGRIYVGGYILVNYLMEQYGADVFPRIHREFIKFPYLGPWGAIKKVTGKSATGIYKELVAALHNRYHEDSLLPAGQRLTPADYSSYSLPVFTARGWYLYRSTFDRFPAIVHFDPSTGKEKVLLECLLTDNTSFTASADGRDLFFTSVSNNPFHSAKPEEVSDLYHFAINTGKCQKITNHAHLWQPALSPDGKQLVAVQGVGSYSRLVEVDQQTGNLRILYDPGAANIYNPVFSPASRKLAFVMNVRGMQDIYLIKDPATATATVSGNINGISATDVTPVLGTDHTGEYYPRFADNERLLFVSDHAGRLELWQTYLNRQEVVLLCQDPVGILAAAMWENNLIYRTYTTQGFCLKEKKSAELLYKAEPWPAFEPYPAAFSSSQANSSLPENLPALPISPTNTIQTETASVTAGQTNEAQAATFTGDAASQSFVDLAWPHLWAPYPSVNQLSGNNITFGLGLVFYGQSLLDETSWLAFLAYHPYEMQPLISFTWQRPFGPLLLGYQLNQSYFLTKNGYRQNTSQLLQASLPLLYDNFGPDLSMLSSGLGFHYNFTVSNEQSFGFIESFSSPASAYRQNLLLQPGLAYQLYKAGAVRDFYAPMLLALTSGLVIPLPGTSNYEPTFDSYAVLSWQFPFFVPHQVIKLGAKACYTTGLPEDRYVSINPRGDFLSDQADQLGRSLFALDYLFTLAVLDIPGPYNFNIWGLSGGLHLETAASWELGRESWQFDRSLYAGFELTVLVDCNGISWPLGAGLAVRFDPLFSRPLNPVRDLSPYFFMSLDSFRANFMPTSSERAPLTKQCSP